jgi:flagellar biosynthesis protein FlhB
MFKGHKTGTYLVYSFFAAILFCIPLLNFVKTEKYSASWELYLGNFLFAAMIAFFIFFHFKKERYMGKPIRMITAGLITTVTGMIISCFFSVLLVWGIAPSIFHHGPWLSGAPAQLQMSRSNGFFISIFFSASIGNISTGSFISALLPFVISRKLPEF